MEIRNNEVMYIYQKRVAKKGNERRLCEEVLCYKCNLNYRATNKCIADCFDVIGFTNISYKLKKNGH